ncbi:citrate synthase family protein [Primorskyibacter aestuariivivens]|uniref:citrate synthase family protein n=1 Tax=Primorskyibacter aestuariivivens TaxID=1888912 RepID=UPI0023001730|nr:citrate synthase family protein [Primorskyibacter aestuariivivens]MDA7427898.1 citrate synthase family protein [Primorskyibacter aestuariivivens]
MKNLPDHLLPAAEVRARLGVSAQTLYAYVSRGHIRAFQDPTDARKSLYLKEDVEAWAARKARGRSRRKVAQSALNWGEPSLVSAITEIRDGRYFYRGRDAVALSRDHTLEQVTALLLERVLPHTAPDMLPIQASPDPLQRMLMALTRKLTQAAPVALEMIQGLVQAATRKRGEGPVHMQLAMGWELDPTDADVLRRVLVLCADHELNASAFACRVAASTGAGLPACLIAGLSTLSGPRHGGMVTRAIDWMAAAVNGGGLPDAGQKPPPGFGHPLYPAGDPRTAEILRVLPLRPDWQAVVDDLASRTIHPSLDLGLAHVVTTLCLPREAGLVLFAVGRSAGWMAHAEEQRASGQLIRPRAVGGVAG